MSEIIRWSLVIGVCLVILVMTVAAIQEWLYERRMKSMPYDYEIDGECDNRSHPRILDWDEIPPEWYAKHADMN